MIIKRFTLLLLGFLVAFFFLESAVRLALVIIPDSKLPTYGIYQKSDPILGHRLLPNLKGVWNREGFSRVETNSRGWNDYERDFQKPENTVRVAIIGDSFVEALQIDKSKNLGTKTENWLGSNCPYEDVEPGKLYDVLLFGVSGWGTAQIYLAAVNEAVLFDPDYVIIAFSGFRNDIYSVVGDPYKPYFEINDDNKIVLSRKPSADHGLIKSIYRWGRSWSRAMQISRELLVPFVEARKAKRVESLVSQEKQENKKGIDQLVEEGVWGLNGETEFVKNAWLLVEGLLLETKVELQSFGAKTMILVVPSSQVVDYEVEIVNKWADEESITNVFYREERLEVFGQKNDIPIIPVGKHMASHNWSEKGVITRFHGFDNDIGAGHWNENGHAFIGATIGKKICEDLYKKNG
ncbi:MAG: hypothetical protein CL722_02245 [Chloroflexi bacterium]|jgi:hypothetical protein|nr:hypothetical protein [Chloroflexota bacterium]